MGSVYVVLIGDLRGSRDLGDRAATQSTIQEQLASLSESLKGGLASPLVLTAGDEVQGVFRDPTLIVTAIQELTDRLYGSGAQLRPTRTADGRLDWRSLPRTEIAFGVGRGVLATGELAPGFDPDLNPALLDGPAFHRSRDALGRTKKGRLWASFEGFEPTAQQGLEALFELMGAIRRDWATAQWVYTYLRRHEEYQKDVAQRMGISGSVVSESLEAAHYQAVIHGEEAARHILRSPDAQP